MISLTRNDDDTLFKILINKDQSLKALPLPLSDLESIPQDVSESLSRPAATGKRLLVQAAVVR